MGVREIERFLGQWRWMPAPADDSVADAPGPVVCPAAAGTRHGFGIATTLERDPHTIGDGAAAFGEGGAGALIFEQTGGPTLARS